MNLPSIPKSFFNGDCFDAYRILGAHPWQVTTAKRAGASQSGLPVHGCGGLRRL